jgi:hypothetical protein
MATLNPSNVVNGNTIQASDIEQLYNAFGTGSAGFTPITGVSLTGSITNADAATLAASASKITTAITGGGTHYLTFVQGAGTFSPKIDNDLEYNPTTNVLTVTASSATSASYAVTASYVNSSQANQINGTKYSGSLGTPNTLFSFIAGFATTNGSTPNTASITISQLSGKALGTAVFVTATPSGSANSITINSLVGTTLTFESQAPPATDFYYTIFYT